MCALDQTAKRQGQTFDVAVEFALRVQVLESFEDLAQNDGDLHLVEAARFHQVQRRAAAQVLHDDPQLRALRRRQGNGTR